MPIGIELETDHRRHAGISLHRHRMVEPPERFTPTAGKIMAEGGIEHDISEILVVDSDTVRVVTNGTGGELELVGEEVTKRDLEWEDGPLKVKLSYD